MEQYIHITHNHLDNLFSFVSSHSIDDNGFTGYIHEFGTFYLVDIKSSKSLSAGEIIKISHNLKIKFPESVVYIPLSPTTGSKGVSQFTRLTTRNIEILCTPEGLNATIFLHCYIPKLVI